MKKPSCIIAAAMSLLVALAAHAEVKVAVGHNDNDEASPDFKFKNIPPVSDNDAATTAKFSIVCGSVDENGGGLAKLHDGKLPDNEDDPGANFFFLEGTDGGRLQVDLGSSIKIKEVNTYSWHPSSRGPQVYKLYASDGTATNFDAAPTNGINPEGCGWKLIADVNTKSANKTDEDSNGGQYGVSISDSDGAIGQYRYLLFDIVPTEKDDGFGNTFYSEIDVVDANAPVAAQNQKPDELSSSPDSFIFKTSDGKCEITIQTKDAPELRGWAETNLAPVLAEWYPQIVAMLPSEGYHAPGHFSITLKPMEGVAYTAGSRVVANSAWLEGEIGKQAVGSLVHEAVHVVQHFGDGARNPGWLVEGTADYIRWFKYEPQSHGADIVWMRHLRHFTPRYNDSYRVTANFLNWVSEKYDAKIVGQMNAAMRDGKYNDGLWQYYTGKTVPALGEEWKKDVLAQLAKADDSNNKN
jgi:hypothetical protein